MKQLSDKKMNNEMLSANGGYLSQPQFVKLVENYFAIWDPVASKPAMLDLSVPNKNAPKYRNVIR